MKAGLAAALVVCSACAPKPVVAPARSSAPSPAQRLAAADAQVRAGCFDCLRDAFEEYQSLRSTASVADDAAVGAARAAALLAIRERELGTEDSGYLERAKDIVSTSPAAAQAVTPLLDIADTLPTRGAIRHVSDDVELTRNQTAYRNRVAWTDELRGRADSDPLSAYLWLAFDCAYVGAAQRSVDEWLLILPQWRETPLVQMKAATCGLDTKGPALERLLSANPRFQEINYFLSLGLSLTGKLDEAIEHLQAAYAWRPRWPTVTNSLGIDYLTLEEFDRAIEFFDRTLEMLPANPDALLNKAKAQTFSGRYTESLATLDRLLALNRWFLGDARYWRAMNEAQLGRNDEAWDDVENAASLLFNAEVPKLAGIIAYRRTQLDVARGKFEESWKRNRGDCETGFYLGVVSAEQAAWSRTADTLVEVVRCFDGEEKKLNGEIEAIRASTQRPERRERQIQRREQQIAANKRMVVTSWFNLAVSSYNLARKDEARVYAEKVVNDEQFAERARELLARLP